MEAEKLIETYVRRIQILRAKQIAEYQMGADPQGKRPVVLLPPGTLSTILEQFALDAADSALDICKKAIDEHVKNEDDRKAVKKALDKEFGIDDVVAPAVKQLDKVLLDHGDQNEKDELWCATCKRWVPPEEPWWPHAKHKPAD